jgi:hypothetical protein
MTYYHASTVGSNLKRLVVHPTLVENHIVVYATPERAVEAFGGDCEVYELEYDENYVADGKCFGRHWRILVILQCRCKEGTSCNIQIVRRN